MGRNYYLTCGYNISQYWNCNLSVIFEDKKSLEEIDLFTSSSIFRDMDDLKEYLYTMGFIDTVSEDVVIACYKTVNKESKKKILVPLYLKSLIFRSDLEKLGITGSSYKEWAEQLFKWINKFRYDANFINYISRVYLDKYESSEKKIKAPILTNGDIYYLLETNVSELETNKRAYDLAFNNFFFNELYKCERVMEERNLTGTLENIFVFKPNFEVINEKGLHDMLINILDFVKSYEYTAHVSLETSSSYQVDEDIEDDFMGEEFLESRDFQRALKEYADNRSKTDEDGKIIKGELDPLDLDDPEAVKQDSYATSIIIDGARLVKKYDGME